MMELILGIILLTIWVISWVMLIHNEPKRLDKEINALKELESKLGQIEYRLKKLLK